MKEKSCSVQGCSNIEAAKGWCQKHYMRFQRHGHILFTRESDWGSREKHPLYKSWHWLVKRYSASGDLCQEWLDLWKFVECVKERPDGDFFLKRKDDSKPFSPDNWYWQERNRLPKEVRADKTKYMREWVKIKRQTDPDFEFGKSLKRYFGITKEQYFEMHDQQGCVCAICKQPECSVDRQSKKVRRLAVDHCHTTGKIRGLLCSKCNTSLGGFKDSIELLNKAINYLGG